MDFGAIGIGAAVASAVFAGIAWHTGRETSRYQMLAELMRDCAQPDMGKAVDTLYYFFRHVCDEDSTQVKEKFGALIPHLNAKNNEKDMTDEEKEARNINDARRRVSHFYHRMGALHKGRAVPDKVLYRLWYEKNLEIIPKIIIPLEEALVASRADPVEKEQTELLDSLWKDSSKPGMTIF